ncbi:MAG: hypothetical protein AB1Z22_10195, partial [Synechococcaceae cyanobacterium]
MSVHRPPAPLRAPLLLLPLLLAGLSRAPSSLASGVSTIAAAPPSSPAMAAALGRQSFVAAAVRRTSPAVVT